MIAKVLTGNIEVTYGVNGLGGAQGSMRPAFGAPRQPDTSYVCAADAEGNLFSATPSGGARETPVIPGLGFIMSSRGVQSAIDASIPMHIAPWKRPRLTPNPAIILKEGKPFMALGTPGGDVQPQAMIQVFLNLMLFGMSPQEAVEQPGGSPVGRSPIPIGHILIRRDV